MSLNVAALWRFPFKGLQGQSLPSLEIKMELGIVGDRSLAFAFLDSIEAFDPLRARQWGWVAKSKIAVQNDWPGLAAVKIDYSRFPSRVQLTFPDGRLVSGDFDKDADRTTLAAALTAYVRTLTPSKPARHPLATDLVLLGMPETQTRFPDRHVQHVSIVGEASIADLAKDTHRPLEIERFRGNIVVRGAAPWAEFTWVGKQIKVGGTVLQVTEPIVRCHNVNVHPVTGEADIDLLRPLAIKHRKAIFGVMAKVVHEGGVRVGDSLVVLGK